MLPVITRLKAELTALDRELTVDLPRQIEEARAHGDLSENAEYDAAKERQGILQARVSRLQARIRELSLYNTASISRDQIGYGSRVVLEDLDTGDEVVYSLVFPEETDPDRGMVSLQSPIGQALLKRGTGDEVTVHTPSGKRSYVVVSLETFHDLSEDT